MNSLAPSVFGIQKNVQILSESVEILDKPIGYNCISLLNAWNTIKGQGSDVNSIPFRKDLTPKTVKNILPYLILLNSIDENKDFIVKIFGTGCVNYFQQDMTGNKLTESTIEGDDFRIQAFNKVLHDKKPIYLRWRTIDDTYPAQFSKNENFLYMAGFPLLDKNGNATQIISCIDA